MTIPLQNKHHDWILTSNGPGEISGQVRPLAREIKAHFPQDRILLIIVPCQFASGHEEEIARTIPELDRVLTPTEYRKIMFNAHALNQLKLNQKGIIIYLGGDAFHAVLLKKRLGFPAYAYFEGKPVMPKKFKYVFTAKSHGNIMVDSVEGKTLYAGRTFADSNITVALCPGSRPGYIEYMVPFLYETAQRIRSSVPHIKYMWVIPTHLRKFAAEKIGDQFNTFPCADTNDQFDLMITLLGTNTAQYAVRRVPMLVLFPFNRPDLVPLVGLAGLLTALPFIGRAIQRSALFLFAKRIRFVALPNIVAKREVTPEMKGYITPTQVASRALSLLSDRTLRDSISNDLATAMGKPGVARSIVMQITRLESWR